MYIEKKAKTVLKYIQRNQSVSENELREKFNDFSNEFPWITFQYVHDGYLWARGENGTPLFTEDLQEFLFSKERQHIVLSIRYETTLKWAEFIWNRRWELWKWFIPIIFSAISLLFSLLLLFFKG